MPPLVVPTDTLPTDTLLGTMVLSIDAATAYGVTNGEPAVNLPRNYENLDFDGKIYPIVGLDRPMPTAAPFIEGTFIEINATKAADLEPGGTSVTDGVTNITTITPPVAGDFLVGTPGAGYAYKENVRAYCRRASGGIVLVEFDFALMWCDTFTTASGKGQVKIRIEARQDKAAANLGVAPYTIKLAPDLATVHTADP